MGRRNSRDRSPRRAPARSQGRGEPIMTLFLGDLPDDVREEEVQEDMEKCGKVLRVMMMNKGGQRSAFVRFDNVQDAERAKDDIEDGVVKVAGKKVRAEMARRNTGGQFETGSKY